MGMGLRRRRTVRGRDERDVVQAVEAVVGVVGQRVGDPVRPAQRVDEVVRDARVGVCDAVQVAQRIVVEIGRDRVAGGERAAHDRVDEAKVVVARRDCVADHTAGVQPVLDGAVAVGVALCSVVA